MSNNKSNTATKVKEVEVTKVKEPEIDIQQLIDQKVKEALENLKLDTPKEREEPNISTGYAINDMLSRRLQVKPLRDGEIVSYKLINAGRLSPNLRDENDNPLKTSPDYQQIIGKELILDSGDSNKKKLIQNVVGYTPITRSDGTRFDQEIVAPIKFSKNGFIHITANEFGTYCFLERSSKNVDNKFRNPRARKIFARVGTAREIEGELSKFDLRYDAVDIIRSRGLGLTELKEIVKELPDNILGKPRLDSEIKTIKVALLKIAETNPRAIINASPNTKIKVKCQVMDAEAAKILEFDDENNWFLEDKNGELKLLCTVPVGEDRYDYLYEFWTKIEHKASYQNMKRKLDQAKTVVV